MELHLVLWIIKSVKLRMSTDSSTTTNLDVTALWLIIVLFSCISTVSKSPCSVSFQTSPSNLLEIEEDQNRFSKYIQNNNYLNSKWHKVILGDRSQVGVTILFGLTVCQSIQELTMRTDWFTITASPLQPDSVTKEETQRRKQTVG